MWPAEGPDTFLMNTMMRKRIRFKQNTSFSDLPKI